MLYSMFDPFYGLVDLLEQERKRSDQLNKLLSYSSKDIRTTRDNNKNYDSEYNNQDRITYTIDENDPDKAIITFYNIPLNVTEDNIDSYFIGEEKKLYVIFDNYNENKTDNCYYSRQETDQFSFTFTGKVDVEKLLLVEPKLDHEKSVLIIEVPKIVNISEEDSVESADTNRKRLSIRID